MGEDPWEHADRGDGRLHGLQRFNRPRGSWNYTEP